MSSFSKNPQPPYYAVIFSSLRTADDNGYGTMAERMVELEVVGDASKRMAAFGAPCT